MSAWFERSFGSDYMVVYRHRDWEAAAREVRSMIGLLGLRTGEDVLDVGCGSGRHSLALHAMGFRVTGMDLSETLLTEARRRDAGGDVEWVRGDMRRMPVADGRFGATVNFFTSFGYFDAEEENAAVLRELRRVLRADGKFLIDYLNPVFVETHLVPHSERLDAETGWRIEERRRIEDGAVVKTIRIEEPGGAERQYVERVRLYPLSWFEANLRKAGLRAGRICGSYDGADYDERSSERLIITGTVAT